MRRLVACLSIVALLATPGLALAQRAQNRARAQEQEAVDLEALFYRVAASQEAPVEVIDYGGGLRGVAFVIPDGLLRTRALGAKTLVPLAAGHQASSPSVLSSLINSVVSSLLVRYKFWWVVANFSTSDEVLKTTRQLKGPGLKFKRTADLRYPARTIQLYFDDPDEPLRTDGVYLHKVKVTGGGTTKYSFVAQ